MIITFRVEYEDWREFTGLFSNYDGQTYQHACFRHAALAAVTQQRTITIAVEDVEQAPACYYCVEEQG